MAPIEFSSLATCNGTSMTYQYDPASQVTTILHQLTATATQIKGEHMGSGMSIDLFVPARVDHVRGEGV